MPVELGNATTETLETLENYTTTEPSKLVAPRNNPQPLHEESPKSSEHRAGPKAEEHEET